MQRAEAGDGRWFSLRGFLALALGLTLLNLGYMHWRDNPGDAGAFTGGQTSGASQKAGPPTSGGRMHTNAMALVAGGLSVLVSVWLFDRKGHGL